MGGKEIFEAIFSFFKEKTINSLFKLFSIFFSIFIIFLIDNTLGFSYSFYNKRKLEQVKEINNILKDNNLTPQQRKELIDLNDIIINKKSWISSAGNSIKKIDIHTNNFILNNSYEKSYILTLFSSSWIFIILFIIYIFSCFKEKNFSMNNLLGLIVTIIFIIGITTSLYFIPNIYNNPTINYIIYFFLPFILLFLTGSSSTNDENTNKENNN